MQNPAQSNCPECNNPSRRAFLQAGTGLALAAALPNFSWAGDSVKNATDTKVKELFASLTAEQSKEIALPTAHKMRGQVSLNQTITDFTIDELSKKQKAITKEIIKGMTSKDGFKKLMLQMEDDSGDWTEYNVNFFGQPGKKGFEFVLSGRHVTMRADGNFEDKVAFGGPLYYGHAPDGLTEDKTHKGNVFWSQALKANEVFRALDTEQRQKALLMKAPEESEIKHRPQPYPGLGLAEMTADQKALVQKTIKEMLSLYTEKDSLEIYDCITANGGIEKLHLSYYQQDHANENADLGNDGVWDIWRLEGPGFAWHFRGAPHVHGMINIARV